MSCHRGDYLMPPEKLQTLAFHTTQIRKNKKNQKIKNVHKNILKKTKKTKSVGKLASGLSRYMQGKHKPNYDPSQINGDYCVVINCRYIQFRGENAWRYKRYFYHTGYPGGLKIHPAWDRMKRNPTVVLRRAVSSFATHKQTNKNHKYFMFAFVFMRFCAKKQ